MPQRAGLHRGRLVLFVYGELATQFFEKAGIYPAETARFFSD